MLIALLFFVGIPGVTLLGYAIKNAVLKYQSVRLARLIARTPWTTYKEIGAAGEIQLVVRRAAGDFILDRKLVGDPLPADSDYFEVALAEDLARKRAMIYNNRDGR